MFEDARLRNLTLNEKLVFFSGLVQNSDFKSAGLDLETNQRHRPA